MRLNLNYNWKYCESFDEAYISNSFDDSNFETVNIPHANKLTPYNNFDEEMYQFISCYRNSFLIPKDYANKRLILEFEAVANRADVYVNGNFAFCHMGSYTAFKGDITNFAKIGELNTIVVKVDSRELADIPPFGNVIDYLVYGGIYREVYLYAHNESFISLINIAGTDVLTSPKVNFKINFNTIAVCDVECKITCKDSDFYKDFTITSLGKKEINQSFTIDAVKLWDINSPTLYDVELKYNGEIYKERIGFREAKFTKNGFYLNGKKLKIVGLNRHQSYPYVGYAMPASAQIADANTLKFGLGLNLVRTAHYPNSKHFLTRCDEIGLLVFTEIPGWQFVSKEPEWHEVCIQHVREMICECYNHVSIILWGVRINESSDYNELYSKTNELAHKLDPYRQTGGVRCFPRSNLLEDVYTFNDFTHSGKNIGLMPKFIVCGRKAPLLITEHNGHMFPTKTFDHEKKRQEHLLRHANVLNTTFKRNNTCGAIGWCMSDYNTHKDFGSGDKICYHGVLDMFRMEKLAASLYKSQQEDYPVLELTSNMEIGDNAGGQVGKVYMVTNCDSVKLYKSGVLINTFDIKAMAKKSNLKHLPHPPVELYDIIGNQIEKTGKYSKHGAKRLKEFLLSVKKFGTIPAIFRMPHTLIGLMLRYKLGIDSITLLFGEFVTNWGDKSVSYRLEGMKNGKTVVCEKASVLKSSLNVAADSDILVEDDTYDVTRITLKAISQTGSVLPYSSDVVSITTIGDIEIIGEDKVALIGGQRAFWIKSCGKTCEAKVILTSLIGNETITIKVIKK